MTHTPEDLRFVEEYCSLCIGHDAALGKIAELITSTLRVGTVTPAAAFKQRHCFFNRVKPAYPQIAAVQSVGPTPLVALGKNHGDAGLRGGERRRHMTHT